MGRIILSIFAGIMFMIIAFSTLVSFTMMLPMFGVFLFEGDEAWSIMWALSVVFGTLCGTAIAKR